MRPTISQYAQALVELTAEQTTLSSVGLAQNFTRWLGRRGEKKKLPAIVAQLEKLEHKNENKLIVTVTTAHAVAPATERILEEKTAALFPGKKVELRYTVDAGVIGGAEFRTDEVLYDATVKAELGALKRNLLKA